MWRDVSPESVRTVERAAHLVTDKLPVTVAATVWACVWACVWASVRGWVSARGWVSI